MNETGLMIVLDMVWRRRVLLTTISCLVTTLMLLESYAKTPMYQAQVRLMIQDERSTAVAGMNSDDPAYAYWRDPEQYYQTQYRILQSQSLAARTIRRPDIDLASVAEFNGQLEERVGPMEAAQAGLSYGLEPVRAAIGWLTGLVTGDTDLSSSAGAADVGGPPPNDVVSTPADQLAFAAAFRSRITVSPVATTRLVDVSFSAADPEFVARAANAVGEEYIQNNLELRLEDTYKQLDWVRLEIAKYRIQLADSERAMADYRVDNDALSLKERQDVVGSTLQQLNDAVTMAMTRRIEKEAIYRAIDSLDENPEAIEAFLEVTDGPYPTELRDRLIRLREQRLEMTARYGERHPRLIAVNASIEQTIEALLPELLMAVVQVRTEYEVALAEEAELSYEFERQKTVAMTLDLDSVNYNVLEREAQTIRTLYESLLKQEKELSVIGTSRTNNIRLMERATVPAYPYSPNHATDRFTAVAVGLTFGLGFVLLLERFNHRIRTPVDLKTGLGVPFFGYVPAVSGRNTPILNDDSPHQVIEALRSIRTTLILAIDPAPRRSPVIAVTSTHPLEGKTTIACNLALTLAQGNSRVLLIDADMRRPAVHKALDRDNTVGLSQFLSGEASPSQVIRRTEEPNLYLFTAGAIT